ncbi:lipase esterase family protein [Hyaloscypha variabilis F]|uniref:Lipase esterase family protein n=1 Tax=Hyaloscypha variabilis (strain UAMH 11265 / GT02V1 / F) TaxID=1149755 RepID=A0A2J6R3H9_HYAVF|nr:lipase esterase family protein [Hyaloscypha variabilis F]
MSSRSQYTHLSETNPAWESVASKQSEIDKISGKLLALPIEEFRKITYRPPPLPEDVPTPGKDLNITHCEVSVKDGTKISIRIYKPLDPPDAALLFFNVHGGGWVVGTPETEEAQNRLIAVKCNAIVVSVDYRKAPEFPYPYALNDSYDVFLWCKSNAAFLGCNPDKIIVGGGSAGANISAAIAQRARDEGVHGIIGQVLNIPVMCYPAHFPVAKYEYRSYEQNKDSAIVDAARMHWFWSQYLPNAEADPYASPLLASSLRGLPPTLVQVAGKDPLRDEGMAYAEELKTCRVPVTLKVYTGMPHAFYIHPQLQDSIDYLQTMVDWIRQLVGPVDNPN